MKKAIKAIKKAVKKTKTALKESARRRAELKHVKELEAYLASGHTGAGVTIVKDKAGKLQTIKLDSKQAALDLLTKVKNKEYQLVW